MDIPRDVESRHLHPDLVPAGGRFKLEVGVVGEETAPVADRRGATTQALLPPLMEARPESLGVLLRGRTYPGRRDAYRPPLLRRHGRRNVAGRVRHDVQSPIQPDPLGDDAVGDVGPPREVAAPRPSSGR